MSARFDQLAPLIKETGPILIAGPTASGKSSLAMDLAQMTGGPIVNADAIQVYENWRVLTARPSITDEGLVEHLLYGHIAKAAEYSVGHWLRDVQGILSKYERPIIVGGTGLYFTALTQGLANIPPIPDDLRAKGNALRADHGIDALLQDLDSATRDSIDTQNPMRVQRAWEVLHATGTSIIEWQTQTPPPLLDVHTATAIVFDVEKDWLNDRIAQRFDSMLDTGALAEAQDNLTDWNPSLLSSKAIGAPDLIAFCQAEIPLETARSNATIATRQFAKRQRTWFRSKMKTWIHFSPT